MTRGRERKARKWLPGTALLLALAASGMWLAQRGTADRVSAAVDASVIKAEGSGAAAPSAGPADAALQAYVAGRFSQAEAAARALAHGASSADSLAAAQEKLEAR